MDQAPDPESPSSSNDLWEDKRLTDLLSDSGADGIAATQSSPSLPDHPPARAASGYVMRVAGPLVAAVLVLAFLLVILLQTRAIPILGAYGSTVPTSSPTSNTSSSITRVTPVDITEPTATATPYTGPNELRVSYSTSSCAPGAISPYPYLDVRNASADTPLQWQLTLSDSAFSLWQSPPNPISSGYSDFFAFIGPSSASAPLDVTLTSNIGDWRGSLQLCSVAKLPTPLPTPTIDRSPPPTATPIPVTITFTCAEGVLNSYGKVCAHVAPPILVHLASVYYACSNSYEHLPNTLQVFGVMPDADGNVIFEWTPTVQCAGDATVVVEGARDAYGNGGLGRTSVTFPLH